MYLYFDFVEMCLSSKLFGVGIYRAIPSRKSRQQIVQGSAWAIPIWKDNFGI